MSHALEAELRDSGFLCVCGKIRNTLRSLQRHIKQQGYRPTWKSGKRAAPRTDGK
jgi:hypothetical protein